MATQLITFTAQVEILLGPDDSTTELDYSEIETMVKAAVERYSRDRPDDVTEDESGDGGKYYDVASLLGSWVEDFSRIIEIEYPAFAISSDTNPTYLEPDDWRDDYWQGGTRYLFFPNHTPAAADTIRIKYTIPYTWTGSPEQTNTPAQDFYAICKLAAGYCCQSIATKYSRTSDATITSDSVSHNTRADQFAARARMYIQEYEQHLGLGSDDGRPEFVHAAGTFVDMDTEPTWTKGRPFLFHGKHTR